MTRHILLASALALAASAAAGAQAGARPSAPPAPEPVLDAASRTAFARLPFDTALVASVHVAEARQTPIGRRVMAALERDRAFQQVAGDLRKEVGFDYRRDLERVWLAMPSAALDGGDQVAFLARLTIDQDRFVKWLRHRRARDLSERKTGAVTYYMAGDTAWAFLDRDHLLIAHTSYIEQVLAVASGRKHSAAANRPLLLAAAEASRPGAHAWLAVLVPEPVRNRLRESALTASLSEVRWTAGRLTLGEEARWRGQVKTSRRESAQALVAVFKQMVETAATSHQIEAAGMSAALRQTAIAADGDVVNLEGSLPGAHAGAVLDAVLAP
jgi:hypothetical protein